MRNFTNGQIALLALAGAAVQLGAQTTSDTARCRAVLSAPSRDSLTKRISVRISPYDTSNRISKRYQDIIGLGIRQLLNIPQPLELSAYVPNSDVDASGRKDTTLAGLTIWGAYRAMLHRDGRITAARVVGGALDPRVDGALIQAVSGLGEAGLLPPLSAPAAVFKGDSLDIRIVVEPDTLAATSNRTANSDESPTPLMQLRLPLRRITQRVWPKRGNRAPRYPADLRDANLEGKVMLEFVVNASGGPSLPTMQVTTATNSQFMSAVLAAVPQFRFEPMSIEGCPVPGLVQLPFEFTLTRR